MTETMKLKDILQELNTIGGAGMAKTASEKPEDSTKKVATAGSELLAALNDATQTTKTAAPSKKDDMPVVDKLVKLAADMAASENEATIKEAHLLGAAFADGCMERFGQYERAAGSTKLATVKDIESTGNPEEDFEKFASENPEITKQAIELGYYHGKMQLERKKQASAQQGYNDTWAQINELEKTAEGRNYLQKVAEQVQETEKVAFEKWASTPEGREAMPHIQRGYADASRELNKLASDAFERGYNDTVNVIKAMV